MSPFYGAELRVKRAKRQLGELKRQVESFQRAHVNYIGVVRHIDAETPMIGLTKMDHDRMARLSIKAGEMLYNLRSSLNYTVFELSRNARTGQGYRWAQFPIETTETGWCLRVTGRDSEGKKFPKQWWLKNVPETAIDAIRLMQPPPIGGAAWSKDLQDLTNVDRHRNLVGFQTSASIRITGHEFIPRNPESNEGTNRIYFDAEVDEVAFHDGRPVTDTLDALLAAVVEAVSLLKACMKAR
jgi:hypothetical protein